MTGMTAGSGAIGEHDLARVPVDKAVYLQGPAGSVTVHHCRMIHGSKPNTNQARSRPLLLNAFSSADALPVTHNPTHSRHNGTIVRGKRTRWIHYDPRPCLMPAGLVRRLLLDLRAAAGRGARREGRSGIARAPFARGPTPQQSWAPPGARARTALA